MRNLIVPVDHSHRQGDQDQLCHGLESRLMPAIRWATQVSAWGDRELKAKGEWLLPSEDYSRGRERVRLLPDYVCCLGANGAERPAEGLLAGLSHDVGRRVRAASPHDRSMDMATGRLGLGTALFAIGRPGAEAAAESGNPRKRIVMTRK